MPIVSSITQVGHAQIDGRRYVVELHTDNVGAVHRMEYLARVGQGEVERNSILTARSLQIDENLKAGEVWQCIEQDTFSLVHVATKAEFGARVRALYRELSREQLARLARWIRRRIIAGDFTETQVRTAFGLTTQQWNALKTRMQALDEAQQVVDDARGE